MKPYQRQQPQQDLNRAAPQRHPRDVEGYIEPSEPDPSLPWVDEQYLKQPGCGGWGGNFRDAFGPISKPYQQPISQPNTAKHNRITGNKRRKGYTPPSSRSKKKQYNKKKNYINPKNRRITGKVKPKPKRNPVFPIPAPPRPPRPPWIINPPLPPRPRPPIPNPPPPRTEPIGPPIVGPMPVPQPPPWWRGEWPPKRPPKREPWEIDRPSPWRPTDPPWYGLDRPYAMT